MALAKEYNEELKREIGIDVDALLAAIKEVAEQEVHEHQSSEHAHMVTVGGRQYTTYGELAAAYELDIRDYSIAEINR